MIRRFVVRVAVGAVVVFAAVQLVPYGRDHTNPPVDREPVWHTPATRALAVRSCFDCHSNTTRWPWYSNVAPVSWLVQSDVDEGRGDLNFSEWARPQPAAGRAEQEIREGDMPPLLYRLQHAEARLTTGEREELLRGLRATLRITAESVRAHDPS
jgi:hypothetical protein